MFDSLLAGALTVTCMVLILGGGALWIYNYRRILRGLPAFNWRMRRQIRELRPLIDQMQAQARTSPSYWCSPHGGTAYRISRFGDYDEVEVRFLAGSRPHTHRVVYQIMYRSGYVLYEVGSGDQAKVPGADTERVARLIVQLREAGPLRVRA